MSLLMYRFALEKEMNIRNDGAPFRFFPLSQPQPRHDFDSLRHDLIHATRPAGNVKGISVKRNGFPTSRDVSK
jgi:hypothetical protein